MLNNPSCHLGLFRDRPESIVLDYFAGSGTTGHAVLLLNKEDNGYRKFILCTNNKNNISEEVAYPRIMNVIEGYADDKDIVFLLEFPNSIYDGECPKCKSQINMRVFDLKKEILNET